ncbi:hypothetical protein OVW19_30810, partial [Klebsiella pneumoniae]|uniref:hypothetical protein n=1 Tax=Klebsiella pneumoniae TaxID=573 RepID=UPI002271092A
IDGHYGLSATFGPAFTIDGGDGRIGGDGAYRKPLSWQSPNAGAVYVVAGSSGSVVTGTPLNHPVMIQSLAVMGSLVLDVDG